MDVLFSTLALNDQGKAKVKRIREAFDALLAEVIAQNPAHGREVALTKTHLEEACFYAVKAVCMHVENQAP